MISVCKFWNCVFFETPQAKGHRFARYSLFGALFFIGIGHWIGFFNAGNLSFSAGDWIKESAYQNTLREAQNSWRIPWQWDRPFYHDTQYFLANPEIVLTPDIFLLPYISNGQFVLLHVLLFYSLGFLGSVLMVRKLGASFFAFSVFWLLFNFNGSLTSHLAVGHLQWTGYFLLPLFFYFLTEIQKTSSRSQSAGLRPTLLLALLIGLLVLNGSFHFAVWCLVFMTLAVSFAGTAFRYGVITVILSGLLGMARFLPAVFYFPEKGTFISGYPSLHSILDGLTRLHEPDFERTGSGFGTLRWWEYDIYIGFVAFAVLIASSGPTFQLGRRTEYASLFMTAGVFVLLSLGNVFAFIGKSPLPFAGVERVSSRFIVMPLVLVFLLSMKGLDELIRTCTNKGKIALLFALPFMAFELLVHSYTWRVVRITQMFPNKEIPDLSLENNNDSIYAFVVSLGWFVSLLTLLVVVMVYVQERRNYLPVGNRKTT